MSDVRIVSHHPYLETVGDWKLLKTGTLDETEELANYVKVALMTDRLSDPEEIIPDLTDDRRGWWGDMDAQAIWTGWNIGCKNWLLTRAKINDYPSFEGATVVRAEQYTREALQPLVDMRFCSAIDVTAERIGIERIDVSITLYRGNEPEIELIFEHMWDEMPTEQTLSPYGYVP